MKRWIFRSFTIAAVAVVAAWGFTALGEFLAVDRCLDAGLVYDYQAGVCRSDVSHLPAASALRLGRPTAGAVAAAAAFAALLAWRLHARDRRSTAWPAA